MTHSFKDVKAWQCAHLFVLSVYRVTKYFPEDEKFALVSQFRRAAVSIPANIAEGYRKMGKLDKLRFMNIAQGSLEECRYYILLSKDIGYIETEVHDRLNAEIDKASWYLNAYCNGIRKNNGIRE